MDSNNFSENVGVGEREGRVSVAFVFLWGDYYNSCFHCFFEGDLHI